MPAPTITNSKTTTATKYGGDALNNINNLLNGQDVTSEIGTPIIRTPIKIPSNVLQFTDTAEDNTVTVKITNLSENKTINLVPTNVEADDEVVYKDTVQTLTGKVISASDNTISNIDVDNLAGAADILTTTNTKTVTNKTLTAPIISTISNTGTLTLPTSTDTLVGRATTDTLTGKTLTAPIISTISNTGTLTLPISTDTLVGKATTDTLTNKTINADGTGNSITNIENADIKAAAGIVYSKLNLTNSVVNGDIVGLDYTKLTSVPSTFAPTAHASSHLSNGADAIAQATTSVRGTVELATDSENAANVVVQGNDTRLSNSRTPTSHKTSHVSGGADAFVKGDDLIASARYLEDVADPTSDAQRIWLEDATANIKYWSDEVTPVKHSLASAANTVTFTNKTIDADGTGNSISNIENADIKAAAGIVYSKLNISNSIVAGDITSNAVTTDKILDANVTLAKLATGSVDSAKIVDDSIVNADVNSAAAIAVSKLAAGTDTHVLKTVTGVPTWAAETGGVHATTHSDGQSDPVTVTNLAGYPGGTTNFLRADGSFAEPPGASGGEANTVTNIGTGTELAKTKVGADIPLRTVIGGTGIDATQNTNDVTIDIDSTVTTLTGSQTLTNKTLTAPVISTISNTGTLTLPTSTDTLVSRATTDTLTNKTIDADGTGNSITNIENADIKTAAAIAVSKLAAGTDTHVLKTVAGVPTWAEESAGGSGGADMSYGPFLYHVYVDTGDSDKFKAYNLDTNTVEFTSTDDTDAHDLLEDVFTAASTARRKVFMNKGDYLLLSQLDVSGLWLHVEMERVGEGITGGSLDPIQCAVIRKAFSGNTSAILWSNDVGGTFASYTKQVWVNANVKGDGDGNGFELIGVNENMDCFISPAITNFKEGMLLQRVWEINIHEPSFYNCSEYAVHLKGDPTNPTTTRCFNINISNGNFRINTQNVYIEKATQVQLINNTLEGATGQLNSVEIGPTSTDTLIEGNSFESPVNAIDIIKDEGSGLNVMFNRFGGTYSTNQNVYHGTATANKTTFKFNNIEPHTNDATATILLDSGARQIDYGRNKLIEAATGTSIVITDNSGNAALNFNDGQFNGFAGNLGSVLYNPDIKYTVVKSLTFGTAQTSWLSFQANGILNMINCTGVFGLIVDPDGPWGDGLQIWDEDYSNKYQIGAGNISANYVLRLPDITGDDRFVSNNTAAILTNKTAKARDNSFTEFAQNPLKKRWGGYMPAQGTTVSTVGTLFGILTGSHVAVGVGTNSNTFDTTEGVIANLATTTTTNQNAGLNNSLTGVGVGRRSHAMKAMIRAKVDNTTSTRYYFGFSSATALPISDTPLANADSGIIVGFTSADTNYQVRTNDGSDAATVTQFTGPIAKTTATGFKTIEIEWAAGGNPVITIDGVALTVSSDLPATTTNLFFYAVAQNATGAIRTHSIKGIWIEPSQ